MVSEKDWESIIEKAVGTSAVGIVHLLIQAGMTPTQALRVSGLFLIESTLGREAVNSLGVHRQTAARWRREIAEASERAKDDELRAVRDVELDAINAAMPSLGLRDLRMVRKPGGDDGEG